MSERDIEATRQYNMRIDLSNEGGLSASIGAKSTMFSDDEVRSEWKSVVVLCCVCVCDGSLSLGVPYRTSRMDWMTMLVRPGKASSVQPSKH